MPTLGVIADGGSDYGIFNLNYILYMHGTTDGTGGTTSILGGYFYNTDSVDRTVKMAIYSDDSVNELPKDKLAAGDVTITVPPSANPGGLITAAYSQALAANTKYWLVCCPQDNKIGLRYATVAFGGFFKNQGNPDLPASFVGDEPTGQTQESFCATYEAGGGLSIPEPSHGGLYLFSPPYGPGRGI